MVEKLPSEVCRETHVQNCHACDDVECGDNLKSVLTKVAERIQKVPNVGDYNDVPPEMVEEMDDALNAIAIMVNASIEGGAVQQSAAKCDTSQQSEVKLDDNRPFPIQGGLTDRPRLYYDQCTIPWWLAEEAYAFYHERYGNDQTIEVIAERGGFGRSELIEFLHGREPGNPDQSETSKRWR